MWEWSNKRRNQEDEKPATKSLLSAYNDLLDQISYAPTPIETKALLQKCVPQPLGVEEMRALIANKIADYGLKNIEIREADYAPLNWQEMARYSIAYQKNRRIFLKLLGYKHAEECMRLGMTRNDLNLLCRSMAPENFNTHIKVPFDFGGTYELDNLVLIKTHPIHDQIHRIFDLQLENGFLKAHKKIFIPYIEGKIYYD